MKVPDTSPLLNGSWFEELRSLLVRAQLELAVAETFALGVREIEEDGCRRVVGIGDGQSGIDRLAHFGEYPPLLDRLGCRDARFGNEHAALPESENGDPGRRGRTRLRTDAPITRPCGRFRPVARGGPTSQIPDFERFDPHVPGFGRGPIPPCRHGRTHGIEDRYGVGRPGYTKRVGFVCHPQRVTQPRLPRIRETEQTWAAPIGVVALRRIRHDRSPATGPRGALVERPLVHIAIRRIPIRHPGILILVLFISVVPEPQVMSRSHARRSGRRIAHK